jgi:hypothetical protein
MKRRTFLTSPSVLAIGGALAKPALAAKDQRPIKKVQTDILVCGGGPAGVAAATMAGRLGQKVLLVERYGRLGGMAVQAMVGPMMGTSASPFVKDFLQRQGGANVDYEFIDLIHADLLQEAGVTLLLHTWVIETLVKDKRVLGVRTVSKEGMFEISANITIDATGDGDIAFAAGCEYEKGRKAGPLWEADGLLQPMTIQFRVAGVNHAESMEAGGGRGKFVFADGRTWDQRCKELYDKGELPPTVGKVRTYMSRRDDERVINATQINGADGTLVRDLSDAELAGRRQAKAVLEFLRNYAPGYKNAYINGMPAVVGVRETRRIIGDRYLVADDLLSGRKWDSAVVREALFGLDIHNPNGVGQVMGVSEKNPFGRDANPLPYDIPYECFLPKGYSGLLTAGRCISGSHEAHSSYRVQQIAMAIGAGAGVGAALANRDRVDARAMDIQEAQNILFGG